MAATIWNGRITFGLVSVPVKLFRAIAPGNVHFNLLHEACKNRIRLQYYCPKDEEVVERSDLVRGYEYEKGKYVLIEEEELEKIEPESNSNFDIDRFIDLAEVDPIYYEKTYYVGPASPDTKKTFDLLATAMKNKNRAGIGKLFLRDREYFALIRPAMGGLVMQLMNYSDEIRDNENTVGEDSKVRPKELEMAEQLVETLTQAFEPEQYKNGYIKRVEELIQSKIHGRRLTVHRGKPKPVITDVMKALEQSLRQVSGGKRPVARAGEDRRKKLPSKQRSKRSA